MNHDFSSRLEAQTRVKFGELAKSFNQMDQRVQERTIETTIRASHAPPVREPEQNS
ncbi:MAG: hypothetical protein HQM10_12365 [Candidatus Riflebacteria bacterium]|nr:hypothetical protein [Candidatus Riflebacteria bacterium]